jgi:hypothetical protein
MTAAALIVSGAPGCHGQCRDLQGPLLRRKSLSRQGRLQDAANDCNGKNSCKGKGWLEMLNTECADQGGTFEKS